MEDRKWKLGVDLSLQDNLLDGLTFEDLITAVHCNCKKIDYISVQTELSDMVKARNKDMKALLVNNMSAIIKEAKKGRED